MKTSNKILTGILIFVLLLGIIPVIYVLGSLKPVQRTEVDGNGLESSLQPQLGLYRGLIVRSDLTVSLVKGPPGLSLSGESNIIDKITYEVVDDNLRIDIPDSLMLNPGIPLTVSVGTEGLSSITATGSGKIKSRDSLDAEDLNVHVTGIGEVDLLIAGRTTSLHFTASGSGKARLAGRAESLRASLSGVGSLDAIDLQVREAEVEASGSSQAHVWPSERLVAAVYGVSNIIYKGNPAVLDRRETGSGEIRAMD